MGCEFNQEQSPQFRTVEYRAAALPSAGREQYLRGALRELSSKEKWEFQDFKRVLMLTAQLGEQATGVPDRIAIENLRAPLDRLYEQTVQDGVEWGRMGVVYPEQDKLILAASCKGTETSCKISARISRFGPDGPGVLALMIHTHPADSPHGLHFSGQDYASFLTDSSCVATIVGHRGRRLMAVKTSFTPEFTADKTVSRLQALEREFLRGQQPAVEIRRFTEAVCLEFGLSLLVTQKDNPDELRKVVLRP